MPQTIINPFTIRLRSKHASGFLRLDDLPDGKDFHDVLLQYLGGASNHIDEQNQSAMKIQSHGSKGRTIDGQVQSGHFGISAELENRKTGAKKFRTPDDCEYLPLYFRCELPVGHNEGILILQRFGQSGTKTAFHNSLQAHLDEKFTKPGYTLLIQPLITEQAIREVLGGGIQKIRFLKHTIPTDVADDLALDSQDEREGAMELVIKSKRGIKWHFTRWMKDVVDGQFEASEYLEISDVVYDDVKLEILRNGRPKTVPLKELGNRLRMNIDLTKNVELGSDGHPTLKSIRKAVLDRMSEFRTAVAWE